jgi:ribosomal protein RSM22 (predicted rRNA methylase)
VLDAFGTESFPVVRLHDRSALAMHFAAARARQRFPAAAIESLSVAQNVSGGTLLLSHVLNELSETQRTELTQLLGQADAVLWVEPGTHADSRALIAMRERLLGSFHVVAPCTHQATCGLLALGNERHWCHHFAAPPKGLKADPNWVHFSQRAGIDLRSVPYSCLVLERKGLRASAGEDVLGWQRVLGSPRVYKGYARLFTCAVEGVEEIEVQRRLAPDVFKAMEKGHPPAFVRGEMDGGRFTTLETR